MVHLDAGQQLVEEVKEDVALQSAELIGPCSQGGEEDRVRRGHYQLGGVRQSLQHQLPALCGERGGVSVCVCVCGGGGGGGGGVLLACLNLSSSSVKATMMAREYVTACLTLSALSSMSICFSMESTREPRSSAWGRRGPGGGTEEREKRKGEGVKGRKGGGGGGWHVILMVYHSRGYCKLCIDIPPSLLAKCHLLTHWYVGSHHSTRLGHKQASFIVLVCDLQWKK